MAKNCRLVVAIAALLLMIACGGSVGPASSTPPAFTPFVFIEHYPAGAATPFSITPVVGRLDATGQLVATKIIDPATRQPLSLPIQDACLSSDGKKVVFTLLETLQNGTVFNVFIANADFSEMKSGP